jgi:hypothetical protein
LRIFQNFSFWKILSFEEYLLRARELSTVFGIFAMCAFGLVFMGCGDGGRSEYPTPSLETPTAADFVIRNLSQIKENVTDVTIVPNSGKSKGAISIYYDGSPTLPTENGAHIVTFDVKAATGWEAAIGLAAGTLIINDIIIGDDPDSESSDLEESLLDYLSKQPVNDKDTLYYIAIKTDNENNLAGLRRALNKSPNKYVYLDLSESSIMEIPAFAFYGKSSPYGCDTLVGITIPDSAFFIERFAFCQLKNLASVIIGNDVISIGTQAFQGCDLTSVTIPENVYNIDMMAFYGCVNLVSVTFQCWISPTNFSENLPFLGIPYPNDLRAKFYAEDKYYGTPGTYTTTAPVGFTSVWTKQP